jgi:hypothetical protein
MDSQLGTLDSHLYVCLTRSNLRSKPLKPFFIPYTHGQMISSLDWIVELGPQASVRMYDHKKRL